MSHSNALSEIIVIKAYFQVFNRKLGRFLYTMLLILQLIINMSRTFHFFKYQFQDLLNKLNSRSCESFFQHKYNRFEIKQTSFLFLSSLIVSKDDE